MATAQKTATQKLAEKNYLSAYHYPIKKWWLIAGLLGLTLSLANVLVPVPAGYTGLGSLLPSTTTPSGNHNPATTHTPTAPTGTVFTPAGGNDAFTKPTRQAPPTRPQNNDSNNVFAPGGGQGAFG